MASITKDKLVEQVINRELSIYKLQLGHWPGLSEDQYDTRVQEKAAECRSLWQAKSIPELKEQLELMRINDTELIVSAIG